MIQLFCMALSKLTTVSFLCLFSSIPSALIKSTRDSAGNPVGLLMVSWSHCFFHCFWLLNLLSLVNRSPSCQWIPNFPLLAPLFAASFAPLLFHCPILFLFLPPLYMTTSWSFPPPDFSEKWCAGASCPQPGQAQALHSHETDPCSRGLSGTVFIFHLDPGFWGVHVDPSLFHHNLWAMALLCWNTRRRAHTGGPQSTRTTDEPNLCKAAVKRTQELRRWAGGSHTHSPTALPAARGRPTPHNPQPPGSGRAG